MSDDADAILQAARAAGAFEATPGGLKEQLARGMVKQGMAVLERQVTQQLDLIHEARHNRVPMHKAFQGNRAERRIKAAKVRAIKRTKR